MISAFDIYLISECDNISTTLNALGAFACVFSVISFFTWMYWHNDEIHYQRDCADETNAKTFKKITLIGAVIFISSLILNAFVPSSKTAASMIVIPPVVNAVSQNKQIQQIPQAVLDLIKSYENNANEKQK